MEWSRSEVWLLLTLYSAYGGRLVAGLPNTNYEA